MSSKNAQEIKRLKALLEGRREEYKIFGKTGEDAMQDRKILQKIKELEGEAERKTVIVLAGNYRQYRLFLRDIPEELHRDYIYGERRERILPLRADDVVVIGTFHERPDADELYKLASSRVKKYETARRKKSRG